MDSFNNIPISETRLVTYTAYLAILVLLLLIVTVFWLFSFYNSTDKKHKQRITNLLKKAETDDNAKVILEKLLRKDERKKSRRRKSVIHDIVFIATIVSIIACTLGFSVIPATIDYVKKDYVVYTGNFTVYRFTRASRHCIILEDGTRINGAAGLDEDVTHGTIVYAKRSQFALGAE